VVEIWVFSSKMCTMCEKCFVTEAKV